MAMLVYEEGNAIVVPIEIKLGTLNQLEDAVKRLRKTNADIETGPRQGTIPSGTKGVGVYGFDDSIEKGVQKFLGQSGISSGNVGSLAALAKNPVGFIIRMMSNPYVAAILAAIVAGTMVHQLYTMRGGIFDLYFKRVVVDENIKGRSRESKIAVRYGLGQSVVITNRAGETVPSSAFNSFEAAQNMEMENIKAWQIRKGYGF